MHVRRTGALTHANAGHLARGIYLDNKPFITVCVALLMGLRVTSFW